MKNEDIVYDPTDIQIDSYGKVGFDGVDITELANEQSVKMLIYQHVLSLHELKSTKKELIEAKNQIEFLRNQRENLRIQLAGQVTSAGVDIASILISFLGGFSINILSSDWTNGLGWVIFVLSVLTVIFFKLPIISSRFDQKTTNNEVY